MSKEQRDIINNAVIEIANEIMGYDSGSKRWINPKMKLVYRKFSDDFIKYMDKNTEGPLFDSIPDYLDFKLGDGYWEGRVRFYRKR